jgi:hypothetical protein
MHIYIYIYIIYKIRNKKRCSLRYAYNKTLRFHNRNKTYATQLYGCPTINHQRTPASTDQPATRTTSVFRTIWSSRPVIGSGPKLMRSCDLRRCWHLLSWAGNTCLSIQSVVPVIAFRCHLFVFPLRLSQFLGAVGFSRQTLLQGVQATPTGHSKVLIRACYHGKTNRDGPLFFYPWVDQCRWCMDPWPITLGLGS